MIGLMSRIWSACDLILKIIQIYSLISSLLQEIGKLDFERHCNLKKIVLQELSVRKRMRYNVGIQFRETPWDVTRDEAPRPTLMSDEDDLSSEDDDHCSSEGMVRLDDS